MDPNELASSAERASGASRVVPVTVAELEQATEETEAGEVTVDIDKPNNVLPSDKQSTVTTYLVKYIPTRYNYRHGNR